MSTRLTIQNGAIVSGSLDVSGSVSFRGFTTASQTNVLTYNSSTGQVFFTASSAIGGGGTPGGSNTQIQFNSGSTFSGSAAFRYIYASQSLEQGQGVQAIGPYSHAEGDATQAIGESSHAEGLQTIASGFYSHAEGESTQAIGIASHAEGYQTIASGSYSHAEGIQTVASGGYSHAEGYLTIAIGDYSHAEGGGEGGNTVAQGAGSHAEGRLTTAIGDWSHAEGFYPIAIGNYSHAEGYQTRTGVTTAYSASIVSGIVTMSAAYGNVSSQFIADNRLYVYQTDSPTTRLFYEISQSNYNGSNTIVTLYNTSDTIPTPVYVGDLDRYMSNWTGDQTIPGPESHAEGLETFTTHRGAHAEGWGSMAVGEVSHAEGDFTQAHGYAAHSEGLNTRAIGEGSHAEGLRSRAIGDYSHAEGATFDIFDTPTKAIGYASHAEGRATQAVGDWSHVGGVSTIAAANYQRVVGIHNFTSSAEGAFIVGNGSIEGGESTRRNLIHAAGTEVQITGSLNVSGSVTIRDIVTLTFQNPLPSNRATGSVALSGSGGTFEGMYVYNGTSWTNVKA